MIKNAWMCKLFRGAMVMGVLGTTLLNATSLKAVTISKDPTFLSDTYQTLPSFIRPYLKTLTLHIEENARLIIDEDPPFEEITIQADGVARIFCEPDIHLTSNVTLDLDHLETNPAFLNALSGTEIAIEDFTCYTVYNTDETETLEKPLLINVGASLDFSGNGALTIPSVNPASQGELSSWGGNLVLHSSPYDLMLRLCWGATLTIDTPDPVTSNTDYIILDTDTQIIFTGGTSTTLDATLDSTIVLNNATMDIQSENETNITVNEGGLLRVHYDGFAGFSDTSHWANNGGTIEYIPHYDLSRCTFPAGFEAIQDDPKLIPVLELMASLQTFDILSTEVHVNHTVVDDMNLAVELMNTFGNVATIEENRLIVDFDFGISALMLTEEKTLLVTAKLTSPYGDATFAKDTPLTLYELNLETSDRTSLQTQVISDGISGTYTFNPIPITAKPASFYTVIAE